MATGAKRDASDGWCRVGNRECKHISMDAVTVTVVPFMDGTTQPKMDGEQPVEEKRRHVGPECEYCNDACRRLSVLENENLGCPLTANPPFDYLTREQRKDIEDRERMARDLYQAHRGRRRRKPGRRKSRHGKGGKKKQEKPVPGKAQEPAAAKPEKKAKGPKPTVKKPGPKSRAGEGKVEKSTQTKLVTEPAGQAKKPGPRAGKQATRKEPVKPIEKRKSGRPPGIHTKIKKKGGGRRKSTRKAPAKSKEKVPGKAQVKKLVAKEPEKKKPGRPPGIHTKHKRGGRRKAGSKAKAKSQSRKSTSKAKAQTKGKKGANSMHMQRSGGNHGAKKN